MSESDTEERIVGKKATVTVSMLMEYQVEVEMPVDDDPGDHADLELWLQQEYNDYNEKEVVQSEIVEEEPILVEDPDEGDYPSHV